MLKQISETHPLHRLFGHLVEQALYTQVGLPDPQLVHYLSNLLTNFVHVDNVYRIRDGRGKRLEEVADMLVESDVRLGASSFIREREVHKHIGDFTLFWTGVYPEGLKNFRGALRRDHLIDYVSQGKKSYYIASTFDWGDYRADAPVLRRLSETFEFCVYGLSLVRHEWERLEREGARQAKQILTD
jgi:hypothetical protein